MRDVLRVPAAGQGGDKFDVLGHATSVGGGLEVGERQDVALDRGAQVRGGLLDHLAGLVFRRLFAHDRYDEVHPAFR